MSERDGYPAGVPCWVDLEHDDPEAAGTFYAGIFGWDLMDRMPPGAPGQYLAATIGGKDVAAIGSRSGGAAATNPSWRTYVAVDDADDAARRAAELGGSVAVAPFDVMDAGRMAVLADPEGAGFGVWQARGHRGAQLVNQPGTWTFTGLHARDTEAALAFYGGLFGWQGGAPDPAAGGMLLLRRPGYGDHLEEIDPGIGARMDDMGAPEGFVDVVATLTPLREGEAPRWDVTFAVDDADAVAAGAEESGGAVLVPPTDMPWVRMTVLRDPGGAEFRASAFVPPEKGN